MNTQPHVARPRSGDAIDDNDRENDGGEAEVTVLCHPRQAKCLRNKLILANVMAWVVILVLLKLLILG